MCFGFPSEVIDCAYRSLRWEGTCVSIASQTHPHSHESRLFRYRELDIENKAMPTGTTAMVLESRSELIYDCISLQRAILITIAVDHPDGRTYQDKEQLTEKHGVTQSPRRLSSTIFLTSGPTRLSQEQRIFFDVLCTSGAC